MREGTIEATDIWKRFHADRARPVLRDEMTRLHDRMRGKAGNRWRWALKSVDFEVTPGESVGLFGSNGSGKSTLLKILTRVMYPTAGRLAVCGRVGALIEVKAGIHPDLTGRENIFLYGSLLGLSRPQVARRFDDIVDFAELPDAIDRQVKFYSSGMSMRLGFGVAAFLEPDVLLVDEVLAVGDAAFQQKCLDRMRAVLSQGTTLVFVSHDLATVEATCRRGVWLRDGVIEADGPVRDSLAAYRGAIEHNAESSAVEAGPVRIARVMAAGSDGVAPATGSSLSISLTITARQGQECILHLGVSEGTAAPVFTLRQELKLSPGLTEVECLIPALPLPRGHFFVWAAMADEQGVDLVPWHPIAAFDVQGPNLEASLPGVMRLSPVYVAAHWRVRTPARSD